MQQIMISLVIATHNRAAMLATALTSVAASQIEDVNSVEVIVVDNNSTDTTRQVVEEVQAGGFPFALRYVLENRQGVAYARNRGVDEAIGKYVAYMDDDQLLDKSYLARLIPAFQTTDAACVGGRIFYYELGSVPNWLAPLIEGVGQLDYGDEVLILGANGRMLKNGNMAMDREELINIGKYEVSLGRCGKTLLSGEEDELQERLHAAKKTIAYCPDLIQYHYFAPERMTKAFWRRHRLGRGRTLYRKSLLSNPPGRGKSFLGAPGWLWRHLIARDIPRAVWSLTSFSAAKSFGKQLDAWATVGWILEAREQSARRKK